ncbi:hypothetical protein [Actinomadura oligospora]|nr:hypothetical protein [Actinomadura oligospora]
MEEIINELNDLPTSTIEVRASDTEQTTDGTDAAPFYCGCGGTDCSR